ncbi:MAG: hypothetical protein ACTSVI_07750 [Promethearchaeota archaeon]
MTGMCAEDKLDKKILDRISFVKRIVVDRLRPTREELNKLQDVFNRIKTTIKASLEEKGVPVNFIEPQGSTGIKQTQLSGDSDLDIFIGLDLEFIFPVLGKSKKEIRNYVKTKLTALINDVLIPVISERLEIDDVLFSYAEHPYLTIVLDAIKADLVFCFDLDEDFIDERGTISAMDRTPLHSKFVQENLSDSQRDDVRLLKAFFKAQHVYGDVSAPGRMGFIGYGIELLIHHFRTMENLMVNFQGLPLEPIDVHGRDKVFLLSFKKFKDDFIIITDPTDLNRNVGSSLDPRAFFHASEMIKEFLKNPDESFFQVRPIPALENNDDHYYSLVLSNEQSVHYTIVRDKLYKLASALKKKLERETNHEKKFGDIIFEIILSDDKKKAAIALRVERPTINDTYKVFGPSTDAKPARIKNFLSKHGEAFKDADGRYYILKHRDFTSFAQAAVYFLEHHLRIEGVKIADFSGSIGAGATEYSSRRMFINHPDILGKQAMHVLKCMVMPHVRSIEKMRRERKRYFRKK